MAQPERGTKSPYTRLLTGLASTALAVGLSVTGAPPAGAATNYFCADPAVSNLQYAPVDEVEEFSPGTGVSGLSVTSGTTPESFAGTYIGHIADALGKGKDMLLFKMSSPVIDGANGRRPAGIWAGMSGSPVYTTDGRLIGAVSYSLNYDNLPIAGVTPAEYMRTIGTNVLGTSSTKIKASSANLKVSAAGTRAAGTSLVGATFAPVKTVNVAGPAGTQQNAFTNRTLARTPKTAKAASTLRSRSFLPAAAQSQNVIAPLEAGGSLVAAFTSGDLVAGSVGTVTAICGDTVYGFGHPMDYTGRRSMFMANAATALIVPDATGLVGSYKQVSTFGAPLGMVTQDRNFGIRGTVGPTSSFGITVNVQNASGDQVDSYRAQVADPEVGASAVANLVGTATTEQLDQYGSGTAEVKWTISYKRQNGSNGAFKNSALVEGTEYFSDYVSSGPANDVWTIGQNSLEDVAVTDVQVTMKLLSADAIAYKVSGAQLKSANGKWKSLSGATLKKKSSHQVRPTYVRTTNGKAKTNVTGSAFTIKLSAKATKSGSLGLTADEDLRPYCDPTGCEDWASDDDSKTFADLLAGIADNPFGNEVDGLLKYKLKKGSSTKAYSLTAPGIVGGSKKVTFKIK